MPVYLIVEDAVQDEETFGRYSDRVPAVAGRYGGRFLVWRGKVTPLSGKWLPQRMITLESESSAKLFRFTLSPECREPAPLREKPAVTRYIAVEGIPPSP